MEPTPPPSPVVINNPPPAVPVGQACHRASIEIFRLTPDEVLQGAADLAGFLPFLPLEIHQLILQRLDMRSLFNLARTSKSMRRHVRRLPKLRALVNHAPAAMSTVASFGLGHSLTCADLYEKLVNPSCDVCGRLSYVLYLLACVRLCNACLQSNTLYCPLPSKLALHLYGLSADQIRRLPMLLFPHPAPHSGWISLGECQRLIMHARGGLVDEERVRLMCLRTYGARHAAERGYMADFARLVF